MKKIFYLASIAALALSSCAKDQTTEAQIESVKGGSKIVAAVEADDTRTHLETTNGKDFEYRWSLGDQLGIYGYGPNTLSNAAFVLDNASDNSPVGVFTSQHKLDADKAYMAVYPRFAEPLFDVVNNDNIQNDPSTPLVNEKYKMINGYDVTMKILPEQKYQNETFYTTTAPSVSGSFSVDANGEAQINMQPVADYLMVNIRSTEEIKTLTLKLYDRAAKSYLYISGESALASYWFNGEDGMEYRYFIPEGTTSAVANAKMPTKRVNSDPEPARLNKDYIVLKTDESYKTVACHDPNTYVFTIPAGILGMGGNIEAYVWVNETDPTKPSGNADFVALGADILTDVYVNTVANPIRSDNFQLNAASAKDDKLNAYDRIDDNKTDYKQIASQLENTVFWMNEAIDTNLDHIRDTRTSFMYNPYKDVIIEHEGQLLQYIVEYSNGTSGFYGKDAFLCAGATFDFSEKNMGELATELKNKLGENNVYEDYIDNYIMSFEQGGGFPCFPVDGDYTFKNNFIGNNAKIINIYQPLQSPAGIFGGSTGKPNNNTHVTPYVTRAHGDENVSTLDGQASINDVTFANVKAWYYENEPERVGNTTSFQVVTEYGYILAASFDGAIKNVTVTNADGGAVMGKADAVQFAGMTLTDNDKLCNIFDEFVHNLDVDLTKTWAELATVEKEIFETITPDKNALTKATLNVINVDNTSATYAKLTDMVYIENDYATATVFNKVSFWTGDSSTPNKTITAGVNKDKGTYVRYAEELAAMNDKDALYELTSDMNLNYSNLQWYYPNGQLNLHYPWKGATGTTETSVKGVVAATIDGAGHTVSQVNMFAYDAESDEDGNLAVIAPFNAQRVLNLNVKDVVIDINTQKEDSGLVVPNWIAGVSYEADYLKNVNVNNVAINAYRADGSNNTQANYSTKYSSRVGWVAARSNNTQAYDVKVTGAHSSAKGIAGAIAHVKIHEVNGKAHLERVTVSGVSSTTVNPALTTFKEFSYNNVAGYNDMGTAVGVVFNRKNTSTAASIEFVGSGKPVFLYNTKDGKDIPYSSINVLYDNVIQNPSLKSK